MRNLARERLTSRKWHGSRIDKWPPVPLQSWAVYQHLWLPSFVCSFHLLCDCPHPLCLVLKRHYCLAMLTSWEELHIIILALRYVKAYYYNTLQVQIFNENQVATAPQVQSQFCMSESHCSLGMRFQLLLRGRLGMSCTVALRGPVDRDGARMTKSKHSTSSIRGLRVFSTGPLSAIVQLVPSRRLMNN